MLSHRRRVRPPLLHRDNDLPPLHRRLPAHLQSHAVVDARLRVLGGDLHPRCSAHTNRVNEQALLLTIKFDNFSLCDKFEFIVKLKLTVIQLNLNI